MTEAPAIVKVLVPAPFAGALDYLPPKDGRVPAVGARVIVPLGKRKNAVGVVGGYAERSEWPANRLRRINAALDDGALIPGELLALVDFAARYYHYPPGAALAAVLPAALRRPRPLPEEAPEYFRKAEGSDYQPRAEAVIELVERLRAAGDAGLAVAALEAGDRARLRRLLARGAAEPVPARAMKDPSWPRKLASGPIPGEGGQPASRVARLNPEQHAASESIAAALGQYASFLLEGVTGSGKTEVYLSAIDEVLARRLQTLVIVPEIALTPQLVARFEAALGIPISAYHSGLADGERLRVWRSAAAGEAPVVIGTRSALFLPLARPGLLVLDEEHDTSLKQEDGFRYHARDLAVYRAQKLAVPIVLGSATPSFESLANVKAGRYRQLKLTERAGEANPPAIKRIDVRGQRLEAGLSNALLDAVGRHLEAGDQVLVFLNRRGFAPVVLCNACGEPLECSRCSARLTWHRRRGRLICHHCGAERPLPTACPGCGAGELVGLGKGTERLEDVLGERFPGVKILRVDRDSTRRRGSLGELMREAASGKARILIGTQMLAKGHDFKALTLVAVVDVDQGLYGADFRAAERMAQLITQVSGRAGRGARAGEVLIQTRHPDHPLLLELLQRGYAGFADRALAEREASGLPPYGALALIRAEAANEAAPRNLLAGAAKLFRAAPRLRVLGPAPAPMLRRAGRYRYQLLLEGRERKTLQAALTRHYPQVLELPAARRVRIALDVDPADLS
ncbi:MAG: primosomal protein N' [Gammaproteobacteria bacterium]|nr:primosomal protein N' [Gammaproteobacteria bacterium]